MRRGDEGREVGLDGESGGMAGAGEEGEGAGAAGGAGSGRVKTMEEGVGWVEGESEGGAREGKGR